MNDAVTGSGERDASAPVGATVPEALLAGRYRVLRTIGSGGMARVVLAHDETLGRRVAVKVLDVHVVDESAAGRAEVETRLLASLNHPGLVTLFDAHLTHEPRFLVMEHVVGMTLAERIADDPLDARELSTLAVQLADALHVVHDAGIVHRDVKPSNILLARSGVPGVPFRAKLADFGIAHLRDDDHGARPGPVIGTAAYIAPELVRGAAPAPPSDIYALGLVLLEAATGERAFSASEGDRGQLIARLASAPEIPDTLNAAWTRLLRAMTAQEPGDRPAAHDVMTRLLDPRPDASSGDAGTTRDAARRAASAAIATEAMPVTTADTPSSAREPVIASPATRARRSAVDASGLAFLAPAVPAASSAPERAAADRTTRARRRRRLAWTAGAVSTAAAAGIVAASVLLGQPPATPTTDRVEGPAVQTPASVPSDPTSVDPPLEPQPAPAG